MNIQNYKMKKELREIKAKRNKDLAAVDNILRSEILLLQCCREKIKILMESDSIYISQALLYDIYKTADPHLSNDLQVSLADLGLALEKITSEM